MIEAQPSAASSAPRLLSGVHLKGKPTSKELTSFNARPEPLEGVPLRYGGGARACVALAVVLLGLSLGGGYLPQSIECVAPLRRACALCRPVPRAVRLMQCECARRSACAHAFLAWALGLIGCVLFPRSPGLHALLSPFTLWHPPHSGQLLCGQSKGVQKVICKHTPRSATGESPNVHGLTDTIVWGVAHKPEMPYCPLTFDSFIRDLLALCIFAALLLLVCSQHLRRASASSRKEPCSCTIVMLLFLQSLSWFVTAAEAARLDAVALHKVASTRAEAVMSIQGSVGMVEIAEPTSLALARPSSLRRLTTTSVSPGTGTLQAAIDAASAGDVLELEDGNYTGTGGNVLTISKDTTIRARNARQAVLDGEVQRRVIYISGAAVVLEGLSITRGSADRGGGVSILGSSTIVTFSNCDFYSNTATRNGGGVSILGSSTIVTFSDCSIYSNDASDYGGGLFINSVTVTLTLNNCDIHSNQAAGGGGVNTGGGTLTLNNCNIYSNSVSSADFSRGGGIYITGSSTRVTFQFCQIYSNTASPGGGVYITGGTVTLSSCDIYSNSASDSGGGAYITGSSTSVTFQSCQIYSNTASPGGGVCIAGGTVTLSSCDIYSTSASDSGGGVSDSGGGTLTLNNCGFYSNTAVRGGGVYFSSSGGLILQQNTFKDNDATSGPCALDVISANASNSELYNNTFIQAPGSCTSGNMISFQPITSFKCTAHGEWMSPTPFSSPPATFTGCRYKCDPGTYGNSLSLQESTCTAPCTIGHYCPQGSAAPTPCPKDTFMPSTGASVCTNCPTFATTNEANGSTSIAACQCVKGYFMDTDTSGATVCSPCPEGATTDTAGSTSLNQCLCDATRFLSIDDTTHAASCPQCKDIRPSSSSTIKGATSVDACECIQGFFLETNGTSKACVACDPLLMDCSIPGITLANMPIKEGGWRLSNDTSKVYGCFNQQACNATIGKRRRLVFSAEASTAGDALCAPGHTGFLCGTCADQYHGYSDTTLCQPCASSMVTGFIPLAIALLVVLLLVIFYCKHSKGAGLAETVDTIVKGKVKDVMLEKAEEKSSEAMADLEKSEKQTFAMRVIRCLARFGPKAKILISLYQILQGIGAVFAIPFPPVYESAINAIGGLIQIELTSLMPLDCIVSTSYYSRLVFKCVWPLVAYAFLALLAKLLSKAGMASMASASVDLAFLLVFILYPSISTGLFSMFYCVPLENGMSWLRVDLSLECSTGLHDTMLVFTFIMLGVHVIGPPAVYCYLFFWKHHSALEALKEQELADAEQVKIEGPKKYVKNKKVISDDGEPEHPRLDPDILLPGYMRRLTGDYEFRTYWFELFETMRKVLLVGIPSTFPERGGTAQLFWGLMVCFITFGAYMMYAPFVKDSDDTLSQLAQLQVFLTLLSSLALRASPPSKLAGDLVTAVLFLVPCIGVALETPLLDVVVEASGKCKGWLGGFINFRPPTLNTSTTESESATTSRFAADNEKLEA